MTRTLPIDTLPWSGDALDRLGEFREARDYLDWMINQAVIECRTKAQAKVGVETDTLHNSNRDLISYAPISWDRIAKQLGVTRQVAWRKYAPIVNDS